MEGKTRDIVAKSDLLETVFVRQRSWEQAQFWEYEAPLRVLAGGLALA